jgi:hypothetical protein
LKGGVRWSTAKDYVDEVAGGSIMANLNAMIEVFGNKTGR